MHVRQRLVLRLGNLLAVIGSVVPFALGAVALARSARDGRSCTPRIPGNPAVEI
jgi:hypothetical protein